ncbi:hypothetical protein [Streptomyces sp. MK5]|uniref:hypothetical protein n=1 Tax=Streptomyces sp. MK5 TaxID=3064253 RepID=UPI0027418267|nr:hypothetical protein [Streptomyces sp. MK5]
MRQLPTPHKVMRKGYETLRSARSSLDALVLVGPRTDDWPRLSAQHLSVLDGRTLNVCVRLPPGASVPALVLGSGSSSCAVPLALVRRGDGGTEARGTVLLGLREADAATAVPVPAGVHARLLKEGQWPLSVAFTDASGQDRRRALARAPQLMPDGPTDPQPVREDGSYCRLIASGTGRAYVSLGRDGLQAEIVSLTIGWSELTLEGRLLNAPAEECHGGVELARRGGRTTRVVPATWHGDTFVGSIQVADFGAFGDKERIWDVRLHRGRHRPLKISRRRTDVRSPGDVFRMPHRLLTAEDGTMLRIHPYYTPIGSLAFRAAHLATGR